MRQTSTIQRFRAAMILVACGLIGWLPAVCLAETIEECELPLCGGGGNYRLADQRGSILVLDFFAYWCVPCLPASRDLATSVQGYYDRRGGNPQRVPVRVVGVNVEAAYPEKTAEYLGRAGLGLAVEDSSGLLKRLGGEGLPFFAILDGTQATDSNPRWEIRYRHAGYEGPEVLRRLIDRISKAAGAEANDGNPPNSAREIEPSFSARENPPALRSYLVQKEVELSVDGLSASDAVLWEALTGARIARGGWSGHLTVSESFIGLDYQPGPAEFWARPNSLANWRTTAQADFKYRYPDRITWLLGGGGYDGFMDYRSFWLNEYYRQRWSKMTGYRDATPWGYNASGGLRWEWLPATAFLQADFVYQMDEVSPGYNKVPFRPLVRRRSTLYSTTGRLTLEQVLNPRLRLSNAIQLVDTTERDLRYGYQGQLRWAVAERWTLRPEATATFEAPDFYGWSAGGGLDYDWDARWFLGIFGRYYRDNGQNNQSLPESEASPPLETVSVGLDLRWQGATMGARLAVGPYFTRYDTGNGRTTSFPQLYRDRCWLGVQAAWNCRFP